MVQNNINTSSLLQSYINKTSLNKSTDSNGNNFQPTPQTITTPVDTFSQNGNIDEKQRNKKRKVAKIALFGAMGLTVTLGLLAAFRHQGGLINTAKKTVGNIKGFFGSQKEDVKKITENIAEYQNGADNLNSAKDSLIRHFMMKIPGYKYFDSLMSSIYKNSAVKAMQRGYSKALNMMKDTDEALLKSVENSDLDSTQIERLKELLYKRFDTLKNLADKSKVKTRIDKLNKSMKRIDIEAYEKMKSAKEGGITKLKENLDDFSRHAWAESTLANSRNIQAKQLEAFENFGLSTQEALELDELIKIGTKSNLQMRSDVQNSSKAMEKIFKKEKGAMFEKLRDINYGCAPADALGILTTMGLLKLYSAQADSKEEKMKVTLTTGLPLMVTLGTTLGATIKMVSGAKALVLGLFTGFIANKTGKTINEIYQKKHNTQGAPSTIITLDDCAKTGNKKYEK